MTIAQSSEVRPIRCLDLRPAHPLTPQSIQGMAVQRCTFEGVAATLVLIGEPPELLFPADPARGLPPIAWVTNYGVDMSGLAFDACDFRPRRGATAVSYRAQESLPLRFRGCSFEGDAAAMLDVWKGTFLLDRCTFANSRVPGLPASAVPGFEAPDGVDIYLRVEFISVQERITSRPAVTPNSNNGLFPAFTAVGCVSRSPTLLATPSIRTSNTQYLQTPVVLMNVRHVPAAVPAELDSIRWFLPPPPLPTINAQTTLNETRLNTVPLAVIGGQFAGRLTTTDGAAPCALVGARDRYNGRLPMNRLRGLGVTGYFDAFVLKAERELP